MTPAVCMRAQVSGSTATVLAVAGWQAVIANVGDSCAYLDTGSEVVLVRCWGAFLGVVRFFHHPVPTCCLKAVGGEFKPMQPSKA